MDFAVKPCHMGIYCDLKRAYPGDTSRRLQDMFRRLQERTSSGGIFRKRVSFGFSETLLITSYCEMKIFWFNNHV